MVGGFRQPADVHLGAQHLLEASIYFVFLNEVAAIGSLESLLKDFAKATVRVVEVDGGIEDELLRGFAFMRSHLENMGYLLGGKADFRMRRVDTRYWGVNWIREGVCRYFPR